MKGKMTDIQRCTEKTFHGSENIVAYELRFLALKRLREAKHDEQCHKVPGTAVSLRGQARDLQVAC
jgi:hypothetical protein